MNASKPHTAALSSARENVFCLNGHITWFVYVWKQRPEEEKPAYLMKLHEWCLQEQLLMETAVHVRPQRSEPIQVTAFDDAQAPKGKKF